nr:pantothenate kinase 2-like isoform X2 [Ipomoea trifida]
MPTRALNKGADIVLGMLPLARELLRRETEVVLVAKSLPALNDITAMELPDIVVKAAKGIKCQPPQVPEMVMM